MSERPNPIDSFELAVLDHTGDIDLAKEVGDVARTAVTTAAEALAQILGVEVDTAELSAYMLDPRNLKEWSSEPTIEGLGE